MTPLIQEMVSLEPEEAINYQWFDMTAAYKKEQRIDEKLLSTPLPYQFTALVCAYEDKKVLLLTNRAKEYTAVVGWQLEKKSYKPTTPFIYTVDDDGVKCKHMDGTQFDYRTSPAVGVIAFIAAFLEYLETMPVTGHVPVRRANFAKKIRQGKVPIFDWHTIEIEPPKTKNEPQGGTHASPRLHNRRGHWRFIKSTQKKVWVNSCVVGDASKGVIFKDYKL